MKKKNEKPTKEKKKKKPKLGPLNYMKVNKIKTNKPSNTILWQKKRTYFNTNLCQYNTAFEQQF